MTPYERLAAAFDRVTNPRFDLLNVRPLYRKFPSMGILHLVNITNKAQAYYAKLLHMNHDDLLHEYDLLMDSAFETPVPFRDYYETYIATPPTTVGNQLVAINMLRWRASMFVNSHESGIAPNYFKSALPKGNEFRVHAVLNVMLYRLSRQVVNYYGWLAQEEPSIKRDDGFSAKWDENEKRDENGLNRTLEMFSQFGHSKNLTHSAIYANRFDRLLGVAKELVEKLQVVSLTADTIKKLNEPNLLTPAEIEALKQVGIINPALWYFDTGDLIFNIRGRASDIEALGSSSDDLEAVLKTLKGILENYPETAVRFSDFRESTAAAMVQLRAAIFKQPFSNYFEKLEALALLDRITAGAPHEFLAEYIALAKEATWESSGDGVQPRIDSKWWLSSEATVNDFRDSLKNFIDPSYFQYGAPQLAMAQRLRRSGVFGFAYIYENVQSPNDDTREKAETLKMSYRSVQSYQLDTLLQQYTGAIPSKNEDAQKITAKHAPQIRNLYENPSEETALNASALLQIRMDLYKYVEKADGYKHRFDLKEIHLPLNVLLDGILNLFSDDVIEAYLHIAARDYKWAADGSTVTHYGSLPVRSEPSVTVVQYPVPDASVQSPPSAVYQAAPAAGQAATMTSEEPTEATPSFLTADAGGLAVESTVNIASKEDFKAAMRHVKKTKSEGYQKDKYVTKLLPSGVFIGLVESPEEITKYKLWSNIKKLNEMITKITEAVNSDSVLKANLKELGKDFKRISTQGFNNQEQTIPNEKIALKLLRCRAALFSKSDTNTFTPMAKSKENHRQILICMDIVLFNQPEPIFRAYAELATLVKWNNDLSVTTNGNVRRLQDVWPIVPTKRDFEDAIFQYAKINQEVTLKLIDAIDTVALAGVQNPLLKYNVSRTQRTQTITDAYGFKNKKDFISAYESAIPVFEPDQENEQALVYFKLLPETNTTNHVLCAKLFLMVRALLYKPSVDGSEVWVPRYDRDAMIHLNAILDLMLAVADEDVIEAYLEEAVKLTWSQEKITFPEEYRQQLIRDLGALKPQQNPSPSTPASEDIVSIETATEILRLEIAALIKERDRIATELTGSEEITSLKKSKTALEEQLAELTTATNEKTQELEKVASAFENQKKKIKAEEAQLEKDLGALRSQLINGSTKVQTAQNTLNGLKNRIEASERKLDELGETESNIEKNINQLKTNFVERKAELDAELKEKEAKLDQAQKQALKVSNDELNRLKVQIEKAENMLKELESKKSDLDKKATVAETKLASKVAELTTLQKQQETQTAAFTDEAARRAAELQELEEQQSVLQKTNAALFAQKSVTDGDITKAKQLLEKTKAATAAAINELKALKRRALDALAQHEYTIKTATGKFTDEPRSAINKLLNTRISGSEYTYRYIVVRPSLFLTVKNIINAFEPVSVGNNKLKFTGDELVATVEGSEYTISPVIS